MRQHVILFGGSFDPVHEGHLTLAKVATKQFNADVWFVLSRHSPFKTDQTKTPYDHRKAMLKKMIHGWRHFRLCEVEHELPDPSYSVDTLRFLIKKYPERSFSWLIGADQAVDFDRWKESETLLSLARFIVYPREGYSVADSRFTLLDAPVIPISSTQIRNGESFATHPGVLAYMMEHSLYTAQILKHYVRDKRRNHILSVTKTALSMAVHQQVNQADLEAACMMHDLAKELPEEAVYPWILADDPRLAQKAKALWHAPMAAIILSKWYYSRNRQIIRAIRGHVIGHGHTRIGKLLYVADKTEPTRGYDSTYERQLMSAYPDRGFCYVKEKQKEYLNEHGINTH